MHTERLLKTAKLLRNLDREKNHLSVEIEEFNLYYWSSNIKDCGTVACAVGHAMHHPWFNGQGLKPTRDKSFNIVTVLIPSYKNLTEMPAVAAFYRISEIEAGFLFMPYAYTQDDLPANDPIVVAERIEKFVSDNTPLAVPQFEIKQEIPIQEQQQQELLVLV